MLVVWSETRVPRFPELGTEVVDEAIAHWRGFVHQRSVDGDAIFRMQITMPACHSFDIVLGADGQHRTSLLRLSMMEALREINGPTGLFVEDVCITCSRVPFITR
jgi:hypothetical protein